MADQAVSTKEISPEEAEAQFSQGFEKVIPPPTSTEVELGGGENAQTVGETGSQSNDRTAAAATPKQDEFDPALVKGLSKRMRKLEGTIGSINDTLKQLAAKPAQTASNTASEQATAEADRLAAIEKTIGEFQEFAPIMEEVVALRAKMDRLSQSGATQAKVDEQRVDIGKLTAEITELVTLNTTYPGWQNDVNTDEFKGFMLANGPEAAEYDEYRALRDDPKTAGQAAEMLQGWKEDHKGWWNDRGRNLFSTKAEDSIAMLERYTELKNQQEGGRNSVKNRTDRLRRNVVPDGTQVNPVTGKSDEDAFNAGFKRGSSKYGVARR